MRTSRWDGEVSLLRSQGSEFKNRRGWGDQSSAKKSGSIDVWKTNVPSGTLTVCMSRPCMFGPFANAQAETSAAPCVIYIYSSGSPCTRHMYVSQAFLVHSRASAHRSLPIPCRTEQNSPLCFLERIHSYSRRVSGEPTGQTDPVSTARACACIELASTALTVVTSKNDTSGLDFRSRSGST